MDLSVTSHLYFVSFEERVLSYILLNVTFKHQSWVCIGTSFGSWRWCLGVSHVVVLMPLLLTQVVSFQMNSSLHFWLTSFPLSFPPPIVSASIFWPLPDSNSSKGNLQLLACLLYNPCPDCTRMRTRPLFSVPSSSLPQVLGGAERGGQGDVNPVGILGKHSYHWAGTSVLCNRFLKPEI